MSSSSQVLAGQFLDPQWNIERLQLLIDNETDKDYNKALLGEKTAWINKLIGKPQYYRSYLFDMTLLFPISLLMLEFNYFAIFVL